MPPSRQRRGEIERRRGPRPVLDRERPGEQRIRLGRVPQGRLEITKRAEEGRQRLGIPAQLALGPLDRVIEDLVGRDLAPIGLVGIPALEKPTYQGRALHRLERFSTGPVSLGLQAGEIPGARDEADQQEDPGDGEGAAMSANEFGGAVASAGAPEPERLVPKVALHVVGQVQRGRITLRPARPGGLEGRWRPGLPGGRVAIGAVWCLDAR